MKVKIMDIHNGDAYSEPEWKEKLIRTEGIFIPEESYFGNDWKRGVYTTPEFNNGTSILFAAVKYKVLED